MRVNTDQRLWLEALVETAIEKPWVSVDATAIVIVGHFRCEPDEDFLNRIRITLRGYVGGPTDPDSLATAKRNICRLIETYK
jgi:hypothetical protein